MTMRLRFDDPVAADHPLYARYVTVSPGVPGRCPQCDTPGAVESVERATHVQNQGCASCGHRWQFRFDADGRIVEVRELAGRRLDLLAPAPEAVGAVLDLREEPAAAQGAKVAGRSWWRR